VSTDGARPGHVLRIRCCGSVAERFGSTEWNRGT
jgi:hypothetical protein